MSLALATVGVASGAHLDDVTNDALNNCADAGDEKNEADPVVPYIRCEHASKRSQYGWEGGYLGLVVCKYVIAKTIGEAGEKPFWEGLVLGFEPNDGLQLRMKFVGTLAVHTLGEVAHNF